MAGRSSRRLSCRGVDDPALAGRHEHRAIEVDEFPLQRRVPITIRRYCVSRKIEPNIKNSSMIPALAPLKRVTPERHVEHRVVALPQEERPENDRREEADHRCVPPNPWRFDDRTRGRRVRRSTATRRSDRASASMDPVTSGSRTRPRSTRNHDGTFTRNTDPSRSARGETADRAHRSRDAGDRGPEPDRSALLGREHIGDDGKGRA